MRGNLYGINTVATVESKKEFEIGEGNEEVVEFRHLVESSCLEFACRTAVVEEGNRCGDAYSMVRKVAAVSGELLVNGDEVTVDRVDE